MTRRRILQLAALAAAAPAFAGESLADALRGAYYDWLGDGGRYRELYRSYLGFEPTWSPEPGNPGVGLWPRPVRFGYYPAAPYHIVENGVHSGFDYDVGNQMAARMGTRAEWIEQPVQLPGGGDDTELAYQQLLAGLRKGLYDVVFAGVLIRPNRVVKVIAPTMRIFPSPLATGRGGRDFMHIQSSSEDDFVRAAAVLPEVKLLCTAGGPSQRITERVMARVAQSGGHPQLALATPEQMMQAMRDKTVDFIIGDALALTMASRKSGGLPLNIDLDPDGGELMGPFML